MASPYEIPWAPPDIGPGVTTLLNVLKQNRENERQGRELKLRENQMANQERRASAEEYWKRLEHDQGQEDRKKAAYLSALEYQKKGDKSTAAMLFKQAGFNPTEEISPPTLYTPAQALAAGRGTADIVPPTGEGPVKLEQSPVTRQPISPSGYQGGGIDAFTDEMRQHAATNVSEPVTPINVLRLHRQESGYNTMVPEEGAAALPIEGEPTVETGPQAGHSAIADLLPMTEEGHPTGALNFTDASGKQIARYDPNEERQFRAERAGRVSEALGPMGEKFAQIAAMIARGDIPETEGKVLITALATEAAGIAKAKEKDAAREDTQKFISEQNAKYKNEPLTVQDRKDIASILARAKLAAAGAGPITDDIAELVRMKVQGYGDDEIAAAAAASKADVKKFAPLVQNVVKNAATGERAGEKRAGLEINDLNGKFLGYAHNATQANIVKKQTDQFGQAKMRLEELLRDIERTGPRVLTPNEIQDRLSKAQSVNAAMRVYNGLGATDASQRLEAEITGAIGTPGHGFWMGANAGIIRRILHEAEQQHQTRLNTAIRTGPGARQLAPSLGGAPKTDTEESKDAAFLRALMGR